MKPIPNILKKIIAHKKLEVAKQKQILPLNQLLECNIPRKRGFIQHIQRKVANKEIAIIAEIKKASPSKGMIRSDFDPIAIAKSYQTAGASCLSVLTDKTFFQGDNRYLQLARKATNLPVLRKDFIIDEYQIYESNYLGADCILLIVAALSDEKLTAFVTLSQTLSLDILIEVHTLDELKRALKLNLPLIGINNRDLHTFKTNINTTLTLKKHIPDECIIVTESGIETKADIKKFSQQHIYAFLIGESLMKAQDPGLKLQEFLV